MARITLVLIAITFEGLIVSGQDHFWSGWDRLFKVAVRTSSVTNITFVMAEINFKLVVITFSVVKITFIMAEITFKVAVITSSMVKIPCSSLYTF